MSEYKIERAQQVYCIEVEHLKNSGVELNETQQAALFVKILEKQSICDDSNIKFCDDNELFISKTPTGFDVVGYYIDEFGSRKPFSATVCKVNNLWYPSKRYVGADTKSCSGAVLLGVLLSLGCTLLGVLMYLLMSAAIGI